MYSIMLLAAVGLGSESPACGHRCHKQHGYVYPYQHLASLSCFPYSYGYSCYGNLTCTVPPLGMPWATSAVPTAPSPVAPRESDIIHLSARGQTARLMVRAPADARLYIDGQRKETIAGQRVFSTPPLEQGAVYSYVLRTEVTRQGRNFVETKRVLVRAGETLQITFPDPQTADIVRLVVLSR